MQKENFTIIIMGVTGDLTKTKLIPALYELLKQKRAEKFFIVGVARSVKEINDVLEEAKANIKNVDEEVWDRLKTISSKYNLDFYKPEDYQNLKNHIEAQEIKESLSGNRIFYLATGSENFDAIHHNLDTAKLVNTEKGWQRIVYEKPFGHDLKSARELDACISAVLDEKNIYRADHYLGKEIVGSIALFRFTNRILEPLWSRSDIDCVEIIIDEDFGIKNRGNYYDKYGAVKDILQSHALQILALLAIESPKKLTGEYLRDKKAEVLKHTKVTDIVLGQYVGYLGEQFVAPNSKTETFFAAKLEVKNKRWRSVPFYVRSGKNLNKKETTVHIRFKDVDCLLSKSCPSDNNYLTIKISPEEGFAFEVNTKMPHKDYEIQTVDLDYEHRKAGEVGSADDYAMLLEQVIAGEQSFFIRKDEIEYSWKIIDAINMKAQSVFPYAIGSNGPKEFEAWNKKNNIFWKS
jgi:glucose-6-phosphate 1-dehydrogenase